MTQNSGANHSGMDLDGALAETVRLIREDGIPKAFENSVVYSELVVDVVKAETYSISTDGVSRDLLWVLLHNRFMPNLSPLSVRVRRVAAAVEGMFKMRSLTLKNVCALHTLLAEEDSCPEIGALRTHEVRCGTRMFPSPAVVKERFAALLAWVNTKKMSCAYENMAVAILFTYEFLNIHPFGYENGSLARILFAWFFRGRVSVLPSWGLSPHYVPSLEADRRSATPRVPVAFAKLVQNAIAHQNALIKRQEIPNPEFE